MFATSIDLRLAFVSLIGTLILSTTCIAAAVGPARAVEVAVNV